MNAIRYMIIGLTACLAVLGSGCATYNTQEAKSRPVSVADVEALARVGMADDVIISQIKNSAAIYHLSAADIIGLHNAGVSNKVIECMINTPSTATENAVIAPAAAAPAYCYPGYYPYAYPCYFWPPISFAFRFR